MTDKEKFDIVIVGGGPAGYVAAIRAAQLGFNTACIEKRGSLGGTCLNVGCIPSKALLHSSHIYEETKDYASKHGVVVGDVKLDLKKMLANKDDVVSGLTQGIEGLFKKNKVTYIKGAAKLSAPGEIEVLGDDNKTRPVNAKHIILATGSGVVTLPNIDIDEKRIVSSTGALSIPEVPKHLLVIGGGYIGLEMATVWNRLGSKITVVEFADKILPAMDDDLSKQFQKILQKKGFDFKLGHKVTSAINKGNNVEVNIENVKNSNTDTISVDYVLMAVGRKPYTEGLGLENVGINLNQRGQVEVNDKFETSAPGIYAVGDLIPGPMLAHKAEEEGVAVVEMIAGQKPHVNYDAIPGVVYTHPEIATVGKTEQELKDAGIAYNVGKFPFLANSRGRSVGETEGFVKILADKATDRVLGMHIIGADAGTMITEGVMAIEFGASAEDLARTCHAHPTLNEAIKEAALAVDGRAVHM